jgi:hypothetical protein
MLTVFWYSFHKHGENVNSVKAEGCNSQKICRLTLKEEYFIMTMPDPYRPSNPGKHSRTAVGTY